MTSKLASLVIALALAAPALAETHVQPAVQPGGDIPSKFHRVQAPPLPRAGDIPRAFNAPRTGFQYVRRTVMIPMRDGVKLFTVLILPKNARGAPIMLDRTPYSADDQPTATSARCPRASSRLCRPNWSAPDISSPTRTCAANMGRRGSMS